MPRRVTVRDFERTLVGMSGGIFLYRDGIDEFFLSHGLSSANEDLEATREKLTDEMYEVCKYALHEAERLVCLGPQFDEEAYALIADAAKALMQASGTRELMASRFRPANEPSASKDESHNRAA